VSTVLADTNALIWLDVDPDSLGKEARRLLRHSDVAVAAITWFELALLARGGRVRPKEPVRAWLARIQHQVRSVPVSPAIAATAAALEDGFPEDPFDRIIYATAIEHGWQLVTKDQRMLDYPADRTIAVW
jgi:PIN domain nuclease of toxin-antitoxin system